VAYDDYKAGDDQVIVVYQFEDTGAEIVATELFSEIAADAAARADQGLRIVSMTTVPLRHSGAMLSRAGSGFETKVAIAVVYAPPAR
jgi:hypothetical protein